MWDRIVKLLGGDRHEKTQDREQTQTTEDISSNRRTSPRVTTNSYDSMADTSHADTLTVHQAVDAIGFGWFQVKLSLIIGIGWMSDGMEIMVLSILGPAVHCQWMVPLWQEAFLTSVVFGGMMLSSGLWGKLADKYGRKAELYLSSVSVFYFGLLSAFSPNYIWLLLLRFLVGAGIGGLPQLLTFYAEFLPSSVRATCLTLMSLTWSIGTCLVVSASLILMPTVGWPYLVVFVAIPSIVFCVACLWLPESPRFDMARGLPGRAMATLQRVARENGKPMPLGKLADVITEAEGPVKRGQIKDLLVPGLRLSTVLLWFIWLADGFIYYGVILLTTQLLQLNDVCYGGGGGNAELVTERECRLQCKTLSTEDYVDLLVTTFAEFPGLLVTALLIETIGRRYTMALEFFLFACFVVLTNFCVKRTVLIIFTFVARSAAMGVFQASFAYTPEVYPTTVRALAMGVCNSLARTGAVVTPFISEVMLQLSVHVAISLYCVAGVMSGISSLMLPIETKGREMEDTHLLTSRKSQASQS